MNIYKVNYVFDPRKALSFKSEKSKVLSDWLFETIGKELACKCVLKLEVGYNTLSLIICSDEELTTADLDRVVTQNANKEEVGELNLEIVSLTAEEAARTNLSAEDKAVLQNALGGKLPAQKAPEQSQAPEKNNGEQVATPAKTEAPHENIFETIESLIAVDELKAWAEEMEKIKEAGLEPEMLKRSLMNMSYLVSVNRGNGSTTVFEAIGKVVAGLIGKKDVNVKEYIVNPKQEERDNYNVPKIINEAGYAGSNGSTLHVFALWIDEFQDNKYVTEWIKLLDELRDKQCNVLFIFAIPYLEHVVLNDLSDRIKDIMPNRVMSIKPMTNEDYIKYFEKYFNHCGMAVAEDVYPLIPQLLAEERSDGRFYGIKTIAKICDEISYNKIMNITAGVHSDAKTVLVEDVRPMLPEEGAGDNFSGLQKLDALVGLDEVRAKIREIIATVKMQREMGMTKANSMHMMFSGAPGTGKTVVARLLGQIMREHKILSNGSFYEVSRKDLVGTYVGHTGPKTAEICRLAYGGVLFIDEAYMLDGGSSQDYGKEAIGTLIAEMENKRGDLVVIFAGYEKELERLFDLNPGLRDRIPYRIHFANYTPEELRLIFYKMLPTEFTYDESFDQAVKEFFENLSEEILNDPNFSNGRFVRNLVERVISKAALRMHMSGVKDAERSITADDFRLATTDGEFSSLNEKKKKRTLGFA